MIEHTTRAFDSDLHELARKIAEMGRLDGEQIADAILNEHAMARLRGPKSLQIIPHASHLFPEPGALEAVIDHATRWFRQYLAPGHSVSTSTRL